MSLFSMGLLLAAAFFAGVLNAIAGGGSFLTLPALALAGVPLVSANATGTAALLPGYVFSAWAFRRDLSSPAGISLAGLAGWSLAGGAVGAALLLVTSNEVFGKLIPWLLLAATALFAFGSRWVARLRAAGARPASPWAARACLFAVAVYGGYFNGGLGILLLAVLALLGESDLNAMNGAKNLVSALLTAIAVVLYAADGAVVWELALPMMLAASAGGYAGAVLARRLPAAVVRGVVIVTGAVMAVIFFLRA